MSAEIRNNGDIRETDVALEIQQTILLVDGNGAAVVVYDEVIFDFQPLFFQHVLYAGAVDEPAVAVAQLSDGMVEGNEKAPAIGKVFLQLCDFLCCKGILGVNDAEDIAVAQIGGGV